MDVRMFVASEEDTTKRGSINRVIELGIQAERTKSFGHGKGRADLSVQERLEPLLLLLGGAVASQHLYT